MPVHAMNPKNNSLGIFPTPAAPSTQRPKPLRIALVIRHLNGRGGGAERIFCELANLLSDEGHAVTCLTFDDRPGAPAFPLHPSVELINLHPRRNRLGVKLAHSAVKRLPLPSSLRDVWRWRLRNALFVDQLRAFIDGNAPTVMISLLPPANTATLLAAQDRVVKVVACNHNVPEQDYASRDRWDQNPHDRGLRLQVLDRADCIHVLAPEFAAWFPEHLRSRIRVVPNYVPRDMFGPVLDPTDRPQTIIAAGRLVPVKNYLCLARAWALLPHHHAHWQVKLFGSGHEHDILARELRRLNIVDSFHLMGHTAKIAAEYREAAIFCHPAHYEGFGLSVAEALACGLPVVAFRDTPGIDAFLRDGENALFADRGNSPEEALAGSLDRMMNDAALRNSCARHAPGSVRGYSYEAYRALWHEILSDLVEGAG